MDFVGVDGGKVHFSRPHTSSNASSRICSRPAPEPSQASTQRSPPIASIPLRSYSRADVPSTNFLRTMRYLSPETRPSHKTFLFFAWSDGLFFICSPQMG